MNLGEIFVYKKKQCIFNACVIFGIFRGEGGKARGMNFDLV